MIAERRSKTVAFIAILALLTFGALATASAFPSRPDEPDPRHLAQSAELTDDPRRREEYLKLAREWTEAATTLQALTDRMMARRPRKGRKRSTR